MTYRGEFIDDLNIYDIYDTPHVHLKYTLPHIRT